MNRQLLAASTLTTAIGLALAMQAPAVRAQGMMANPPQVVKDNMARREKDKLQKCYGINAAAKNDCAVGLRFQHHQAVLEAAPDVAFMEIHTENYMGGGSPIRYLDAARRDFSISLHGVGLSLGSAEGLDPVHLNRVQQVAERIEPALISEHVAWSVSGGSYLADLLPLPMTEEALDVICRNVDQMQSVLKRAILVENPSTYVQFRHSTIPEWQFMATVAARTGCGILCDINNIFISAKNHGWDAYGYVAKLPCATIGEIHLAGHSVRQLPEGGVLRIDDHGSRVVEDVWSLYAEALRRFGPVPTLIEWDTDVPPLDVLVEEARRADVLIAIVNDEARRADAA
jgi:uncharacterized protein (UPF0276 family)